MQSKRLTARGVHEAKPGKKEDGAGLRLVVDKKLNKHWVLRFTLNGKRREMGLGCYPDVTLSYARELATEARNQVKLGKDPIQAKKDALQARQRANEWTFDKCAKAYINSHKSAWKSLKHLDSWQNSLKNYASPVIGPVSVSNIDTAAIMQVIEPIWLTKNETASRVRSRIEKILDWATVHKYRQGDNPARWQGNLKQLLPSKAKIQKTRHMPAMPYTDIGVFFTELRTLHSISAKALQFTILTATRTNEILLASWDEIDLKAEIWAIPAERMKSNRIHRVPLSKQAVQVLESIPIQKGWLFPSLRYGKHLSNMAMLKVLKQDLNRKDCTVHGFRSTFRDWCAEQTNYPRELAESALAHVLADKTEAAYQRGDMLEKRRKLMQHWADYCGQVHTKGDVLPIRKNF